MPSATTDVLADAAREAGATVVIGLNERDAHSATIYNALLYLGPDGEVLTKHRKLVPTGAERTVWGMGDGSTLDVVQTPIGRVGGLICWENYMPLARFAMYAQGVDVWVAPTLATGDGWIATMRHIAREARCYVIGVNPCTHVDQIPADFPMRDRIWNAERDGAWVEDGNSVIGSRRRDSCRAGAPAGNDPLRRHRHHERARRSQVCRSDGSLQPARRVSPERRHETAPSSDLRRRLRRASPTSAAATCA